MILGHISQGVFKPFFPGFIYFMYISFTTFVLFTLHVIYCTRVELHVTCQNIISLSSSLSALRPPSPYDCTDTREVIMMSTDEIGQYLTTTKHNKAPYVHYDDVIIGTMASQITSLTIVYSAVYSGANQRKHQSSVSLAFVRGIHRSPVNSPHKWQVTRKMFPFDDTIMVLKYWNVPYQDILCHARTGEDFFSANSWNGQAIHIKVPLMAESN